MGRRAARQGEVDSGDAKLRGREPPGEDDVDGEGEDAAEELVEEQVGETPHLGSRGRGLE